MSRIAEVAVVFLYILTSVLGENGIHSEHHGVNSSPSNGSSPLGTTSMASSHLTVTEYSHGAHQKPGTLSSNVTYSDNATVDSRGDFNLILEQFIEYRMYKVFVDYFVSVTSVPGLVTNPLFI